MDHELIGCVRELASKYPEAIYENDDQNCYYTIGACGNGNGCIIGQALVAMNPELLDDLIASDNGCVPFAGELVYQLELALSEKEVRWLNSVQGYQDEGKSWGEAIKKADKVLEIMYA